MVNKLTLSLLLIFSITNIYGQIILKPGFDADEYRTMLKISERQMDSVRLPYNLPWPAGYNRNYQSGITGMDNRFEVWENKNQHIIVISIRGTTTESISWVENFYAGMIPAIGKIKIDSSGFKDYKVAENPNAYVHAGWMIGMMSLAPDIIVQIRHYYDIGYRNFIIFGHSQGGAIAFLFRSYLQYMNNPLPTDITIKTISSAAPKPGNLYYSYDYAHITHGGWGLRVINTLDWVPEVPFSIQTMDDLNKLNPFIQVNNALRKMSLLKRIYLKRAFKKLDKSTKKARNVYIKYLGYQAFALVKDHIPEADLPNYSNSFDYSTAGTPVILVPGRAYFENYLPNATMGVFNNHLMYPYFLACLETFPERD